MSTIPAHAAIDLEPASQITGWMTRRELRWLAEQACAASTIVEVGCFHGRSTRVLADHCRGVVYAVDPWDGRYFNNDDSPADWIDTDVFDAFAENLSAHLASGRVVAQRGPARTMLPAIAARVGRTCDLVFLDGDHRYAAVVSEIDHARALVKSGGIIAGHDWDHPTWPGVRRAVEDSFPHRADVHLVGSIWWVRI